MNPWPLDDARHNLILLGKELLLLEGHLADPARHCPSCVLKHALTCAGLCEEAARMPGAAKWAQVWQGCKQVVAAVLKHQPVAQPANPRMAPADHMTQQVREVRRAVLEAILQAQRGAMQVQPVAAAGLAPVACDRTWREIVVSVAVSLAVGCGSPAAKVGVVEPTDGKADGVAQDDDIKTEIAPGEVAQAACSLALGPVTPTDGGLAYSTTKNSLGITLEIERPKSGSPWLLAFVDESGADLSSLSLSSGTTLTNPLWQTGTTWILAGTGTVGGTSFPMIAKVDAETKQVVQLTSGVKVGTVTTSQFVDGHFVVSIDDASPAGHRFATYSVEGKVIDELPFTWGVPVGAGANQAASKGWMWDATSAPTGGYVASGISQDPENLHRNRNNYVGWVAKYVVPAPSAPEWIFYNPGSCVAVFRHPDGGYTIHCVIDPPSSDPEIGSCVIRLAADGKERWRTCPNSPAFKADDMFPMCAADYGDGSVIIAIDGMLSVVDPVFNPHASLARVGRFGTVDWSVSGPDGPWGRPSIGPRGEIIVLRDVFDGVAGVRSEIWRLDPWGHSSCAESGPCFNKSWNDCLDTNPCTADLCDAAHGGCYHVPLPDGATCTDSGNHCKAGTCNP